MFRKCILPVHEKNSLHTVPVQPIYHPLATHKEVKLFMLRLDRIHPFISGNKWYKLKYNLQAAQEQKAKALLTYGGAFSNHIAAVAAAGKEGGWPTIGIIRGEEKTPLNPTLAEATKNGMQLYYVSRELYRDKSLLQEYVQQHLDLTDTYIIPEGGANALGVKGCAEIIQHITFDFDYICCACGTGATLAGIISSLSPQQQALGVSALKGGDFLYEEVRKWTGSERKNFSIDLDHHEGGYAKTSPALFDFMSDFTLRYQIPLDYVYTAKLMRAVMDKITQDFFPRGSTVVAIHTGGLQGNKGWKE
jgi:1-aminocyclopropane-1-carboxylate deaminase